MPASKKSRLIATFFSVPIALVVGTVLSGCKARGFQESAKAKAELSTGGLPDNWGLLDGKVTADVSNEAVTANAASRGLLAMVDTVARLGYPVDVSLTRGRDFPSTLYAA